MLLPIGRNAFQCFFINMGYHWWSLLYQQATRLATVCNSSSVS